MESTTPTAHDATVDVIDLTDPEFLHALMEERHARRFDEAHIVD